MLQIKNLKAGYNKMEILKGVDFKINSGEVTAIIGPNGAGKSTLLKSIFNLCDIYSGDIYFKGENIAGLPTHKLIYKGISYVPQGRQVFHDLTVEDNIEMGVFAIKKSRSEVKGLIDKVYGFFPVLKERRKEMAASLSGGEQQMLSLGRALVQDPKLLLLDEPSLGLSPKSMRDIFEKVKKINQEGVSVIIVEQNAKQAVEVANLTYVLENGKVALTGESNILESKKLKNIYLGGAPVKGK